MNKTEQLLEDIEIVQTSTETRWKSRRRISNFILPAEEYSFEDLQLKFGREFSFRPSLGNKIYIRTGTQIQCEEMLMEIWRQAKINIEEKPLRAPTKALKAEFQNYLRLRHAALLVQEGIQTKFILGQTGLTAGQLSALRGRLAVGAEIMPCKKGKESALKQVHIDWLQEEMNRGRLVGLTALEIQERLLGQFGDQAPSIKRSRFSYALRHKLRWSYHYPLYQKAQMNEEETIKKRAIYAKQIIPQLYKGRHVIYIDETSFHLRDISRRSWQLRGRKSIVKEHDKKENYTLIGALDENGFIGYMIAEKGAQQEQFMGFLSCLVKTLRQRGGFDNCLLVFDNARIHNSKLVTSTLLDHIPHIFLAPYSPQLNPIEKLWALLKNRVSKRRVRSLQDLVRVVKISSESIPPFHAAKIVRFTYLYLLPSMRQQPLEGRPVEKKYKISIQVE